MGLPSVSSEAGGESAGGYYAALTALRIRDELGAIEGVINYLARQHAAATVAAIAGRSAPGSRLVVHYQVRSGWAAFGRLLARTFLRLSRREDPMANEPRRSSWTRESVRAMLTEAGLEVTDDVALVSLADELSLPTRQLRTSGVAVAVAPV
jgi:O-methyltransferase involved in polyketide biosynthesis